MEAEFASEEEMATFSPPDLVRCEVSSDDRFSGGRLARTSTDELKRWLAELI